MLVPFSLESCPFLFLSTFSRTQMHNFPFPQTWQQQDLHDLFPVGVLGLTAESEAGAEPLAEAQRTVGPGSGGAGGDLKGGVAELPLQQPLPKPPAQGGGRPGSGGAAAAQTLVLLGAGGAQQPWGGWGEMGGIRGAPPLPGTPASCPQGTPHSQTTERLREIFWEPSGF